MRRTELANICEGLLFRAFRQVEVGSRGIVVALTSPRHVRVSLEITNALTSTLCQDEAIAPSRSIAVAYSKVGHGTVGSPVSLRNCTGYGLDSNTR